MGLFGDILDAVDVISSFGHGSDDDGDAEEEKSAEERAREEEEEEEQYEEYLYNMTHSAPQTPAKTKRIQVRREQTAEEIRAEKREQRRQTVKDVFMFLGSLSLITLAGIYLYTSLFLL